MLDFTVESPKRFLNEIVSLAEPGKTARAPVDRRSVSQAIAPSAGMPRRRRRHDNLYSGKPAPLEW